MDGFKHCSFAVFIYSLAFQISGVRGELYPYGLKAGDTLIQDSTLPTLVNFTHPLVYYGRSYFTTWITKDGTITFNKETTYEPHFWRDNPEFHNHPFIAPYFYDGGGKTSSSLNIPGNIFYRVIYKSLGVEQPFLNDLHKYLVKNVVGVNDYEKNNLAALVVTWEDVTDSSSATDGCVDENEAFTCTETNTFQVVIVMSDAAAYVIFNYKKMDLPDHHFYQAGMNGGFSNGWKDVFCGERCGRMDLNLLPTLQGSDVVGRFIFKISDEVMVRGGCLPPAASSGLEFYPHHGNMFGGEIIDVSGYCVSPEQEVTCQFGSGAVAPAKSFTGSTRYRCEVPRLTERGLVDLVVSWGPVGQLTGQFHIVLFGRSEHHLILDMDTPGKMWNETTASELSLTWDTNSLGDQDLLVDINLIGYREDTVRMYWDTLNVLGEGILSGDGHYTFQTADHNCKGDQCSMYEMGIVEVRIPSDKWTQTNRYSYYNYGVLPLGWFVNDYMIQEYGSSYSTTLCRKWYSKDKEDMTWQEELPQCPCTMSQAMTDFGRWQPDVGCNVNTGSKCHYHQGAVHCVRSVTPTKSGAGNQCCYRKDGNLQYAADSYQGSTPDRSHDWGAPPFNKPDYVPSLSHWKHDVISFYHCCLWVENSECDLYMEQRPTKDCKSYNPSKSAFVYGDPHISTFDSLAYNFHGKGEFWLVKHKEFFIQGRFNQVFTANATGLVAVAIKGKGTSVVELRVVPVQRALGFARQSLNVVVDGRTRQFNQKMKAPEWQDFIGVSVVQNQVNNGNFTIILNSGVGVQVSVADFVSQLIYLTVVIPDTFKGSTKGLLGNWDDDITNEFIKPDETYTSIISSPEDVHIDFGLAWGVSTKNSLFQYPTNFDLTFISNYHYVPIVPGTDRVQIRNTCGEDQNCIHDFRVTGDADVARASLQNGVWIRTVKDIQTKVLNCGLLDVAGGVKSNVNYSLSSKITITSCKTGALSGHPEYICIKNSDGEVVWDPEVTASCEDTPKMSNLEMVIGIVVAALAAIGIVIIVVVLLVRKRRSSNRKGHREGDEESSRDPATRTAMVRTKRSSEAGDPKRNSEGSRTSEASL